MKKALTSIPLAIAILSVAGSPASSQELVRIDPRYYCAAEPGPVPEEVFTLPPTPEAEAAVREILDLIVIGTGGWSLWASSQDKASASMDPVTGERRIIYNEDFINDLRGESESVWANVAILAHEVAHHLNDHLQIGNDDRRRIEELQADRFAGYVLFRKGASEEATQRVFRALGGGGAYPPVRDRVAAARNGWLRARGLGPAVADMDTILSDDDVEVATVDGRRVGDTDVADPPRVTGLAAFGAPSPSVFHAGGGAPGPGFMLRLQGRLEYERPASVRVGIYFWFRDGRVLFAHPQEPHYRRGSNNQVATGVPRFRFAGGQLDLASLLVDPLPYYVLNLGPALYQRYDLVARVFVYVDDELIASSSPTDLWVVW